MGSFLPLFPFSKEIRYTSKYLIRQTETILWLVFHQFWLDYSSNEKQPYACVSIDRKERCILYYWPGVRRKIKGLFGGIHIRMAYTNNAYIPWHRHLFVFLGCPCLLLPSHLPIMVKKSRQTVASHIFRFFHASDIFCQKAGIHALLYSCQKENECYTIEKDTGIGARGGHATLIT